MSRRLPRLLCLAACLGSTLSPATHARSSGAPLVPPPDERGTLIYLDGNHLTGRLIAPGVFASDRFGEIRFGPEEASFQSSPTPPTPAPTTAPATAPRLPADAPPAALRDQLETAPPPQPAKDAAKTPSPWHPWKISLSGFVESAIEGDGDTHEYYANLRLERPRSGGHEASVEARYELEERDGDLTERKATLDADWRRDFAERWFTLYRPDIEYNGIRASEETAAVIGEDRVDYVLALHHLGVGYRLLDRPALRSNLAVGWAYLHLNIFGYGSDDTHGPAFLFENELKLPQGFELTQTARAYYPEIDNNWYWENEIALTKRFNEWFFLTLRHEYRGEYGPLNVSHLNKLRLLFGVRL